MTGNAVPVRRIPWRVAVRLAGVGLINALVAPSVLLAFVLFMPEGALRPAHLLLATLAGAALAMALTLFALYRMLGPVWRVELAMRQFAQEGRIVALPQQRGDLSGRLMGQAHQLMTRAQERIVSSQQSAETDPLTKVLNRRGFERRVIEPLSRKRPARAGEEARVGAMVYFDLDYFKQVNDRYGHEAGDQVLRRVAELAQRQLEAQDVLARFGGEEFVVWLPGAAGRRAYRFAEGLRGAIEREAAQVLAELAFDSPLRRLPARLAPVEQQLRVTASIGIALSTFEAPLGPLEAIRRADAAAYVSKIEGRNRITPAQRLAA